MNEFMGGKPTGLPNLKSRFTLALLEDSGWYRVNYQAADQLVWGYRAGCSFLTSCTNKPDLTPKAFCESNFLSESSNAYRYATYVCVGGERGRGGKGGRGGEGGFANTLRRIYSR